MKLFPAIVTLHLLGGMVLLALLVHAGRALPAGRRGSGAGAVPPALRALLLVGAPALLWLQIALGGWVSTNYAVLACTQLPDLPGQLVAADEFRQGFELWRAAGHDRRRRAASTFAALTAIHYAHRLMAYCAVRRARRAGVAPARAPALRAQARWLAGLALLQFATGLSNVVLGWPLVAAVAAHRRRRGAGGGA